MSAKLLKSPFATGHTAEVYLWEDGYILKLFREWFPLEAIEHEAKITRIVHTSGLSIPAVVGEVIEIDGRYGLVYERINGVSMLENLVSRPWTLFQSAHLLAKLQVDTHQLNGIRGLPSQHEKLQKKIQSAKMLSPDLKEQVLSIFGELPHGNQLCHGDFHPDNVLLTENGPVIIDWIDATCGNSLSDAARTSILMSKAQPPNDKRMHWTLNLFREWLHRAYLRRYFQLCPSNREEFAAWQIVNAAGRLSEDVPEEQALLAFVKTSLSTFARS